MDYDALVAKVIELLQREKRVPYRALKRRFDLDDEYIEDLKDELIYAKKMAVDEENRVLVWVGEQAPTPPQTPQQPRVQAPQPPDEPPREPRPREAERRQLTVMFCDLVDSTKLSSQLDPEDYREVVRAYQSACTEVIQRYDGHVAQFLGDGLLVYFGYPVAHEEDAQRAIHTGLGIVGAIRTLNTALEQDKGIRLAVRLGVHTGLAVIGKMGGEGRQEQLALGETPNVAARIQGLAAPDTVVISNATYRLVQGYFDCQELGEQHFRGVAQPVPIYQVLQESGVQSRLDVASTRGLTPLVGRESEVTLLLERWEQAKDGQGQVILLSGEAGIGKSRLVQVLKNQVASELHTRQECRCSPYHTNSAFFPLAELLQRRFGWQSEDTADEKLHKLETVLPHTHLDLNTAVPLFTALFSLPLPDDRYPPMQLSSQQQRQHTLGAFLQLLLLAAEQHPVLFIVEDLHWVDPSTLEFLELLIDQTPTTCLYVLATCRPEFQPPWSHRSYLTEMTITRLTRHQIERMATQVAGGKILPADVLEQLADKTDGVPLYVEEMTKSILESGHLKAANGHYELSGSLASLTIPTTLQDSLIARLDRLMTAKVVAQLGATIGRQFGYELLQAVAQLDDPTLQRELGRLVDAELLYQLGLPPHATYTFKHALIQDTAYESLLRSTRQGYHRRIAEVLEERFPETVDQQPELLAHHCTEAGRIEQAVGYWHTAGQQAVERSAHAEAIAHLRYGLALLQTLQDTPQRLQQELALYTALGSAFMATKGYANPEVEHAYSRAHALCQQMGEHPQLFQVLMGLSTFYFTRAEYQTARALGERLLALVQRQQAPIPLLRAHTVLGLVSFHMGNLVSARQHLEQGIAVYGTQHRRTRAPRGPDPRVGCLAYGAWTLWWLGYPNQAEHRSRDALAFAQQLAHPLSRTWALGCMTFLHHCRREVQGARESAEACLRLATEHGFPFWVAAGTLFRGWARTLQGQTQEGMAEVRQGIAAWRATGAELSLSHWLGILAEVERQRGQPATGLAVLVDALAVVEKTQERYYEAELYRLKGELIVDLEDGRRLADCTPEACFQQALDIAQQQHAKSWELRAATSLAKLWQSQGKRHEAYDLLEPVYNWFTEGFDTLDLIEAKALLEELA